MDSEKLFVFFFFKLWELSELFVCADENDPGGRKTWRGRKWRGELRGKILEWARIQ